MDILSKKALVVFVLLDLFAATLSLVGVFFFAVCGRSPSLFPFISADAKVSVLLILSKKSFVVFFLEATFFGALLIFPFISAEANVSVLDILSKKPFVVVFCLGLFLDDAEDIDDADDNRGPLGEVLFFDADDDAVSAFASLSQIDSVVIMD